MEQTQRDPNQSMEDPNPLLCVYCHQPWLDLLHWRTCPMSRRNMLLAQVSGYQSARSDLEHRLRQLTHDDIQVSDHLRVVVEKCQWHDMMGSISFVQHLLEETDGSETWQYLRVREAVIGTFESRGDILGSLIAIQECYQELLEKGEQNLSAMADTSGPADQYSATPSRRADASRTKPSPADNDDALSTNLQQPTTQSESFIDQLLGNDYIETNDPDDFDTAPPTPQSSSHVQSPQSTPARSSAMGNEHSSPIERSASSSPFLHMFHSNMAVEKAKVKNGKKKPRRTASIPQQNNQSVSTPPLAIEMVNARQLVKTPKRKSLAGDTSRSPAEPASAASLTEYGQAHQTPKRIRSAPHNTQQAEDPFTSSFVAPTYNNIQPSLSQAQDFPWSAEEDIFLHKLVNYPKISTWEERAELYNEWARQDGWPQRTMEVLMSRAFMARQNQGISSQTKPRESTATQTTEQIKTPERLSSAQTFTPRSASAASWNQAYQTPRRTPSNSSYHTEQNNDSFPSPFATPTSNQIQNTQPNPSPVTQKQLYTPEEDTLLRDLVTGVMSPFTWNERADAYNERARAQGWPERSMQGLSRRFSKITRGK